MNITIEGEGEPMKPFQLWRVDKHGNQIERIGEYDTLEEMRAVRHRLDWLYAEYQGRRKLEPPMA
jgi:hypothetical protein